MLGNMSGELQTELCAPMPEIPALAFGNLRTNRKVFDGGDPILG
jgi:hypothetical protein